MAEKAFLLTGRVDHGTKYELESYQLYLQDQNEVYPVLYDFKKSRDVFYEETSITFASIMFDKGYSQVEAANNCRVNPNSCKLEQIPGIEDHHAARLEELVNMRIARTIRTIETTIMKGSFSTN